MFERFTEHARQVVVLAQEEARTLQHECIGTGHILLSLVREDDAVARRILLGFDAHPDEIRDAVVSMLLGRVAMDQAARQPDVGADRADARAGAAVPVRGDYGPRLPAVRSLSGEELDGLIDELAAEALRISCRRRVLADQLGVLRAERHIRRQRSSAR